MSNQSYGLILWICFLAFLVSCALGQIEHLEPVSGLVLSRSSERPQSSSQLHSQSTLSDPKEDDTLKISFQAFGEQFDFTLVRQDVFASDGVYVVSDERGLHDIPAHHGIYGTDINDVLSEGNSRIASVTVMEDGRIDAMIIQNGEIYQLQHTSMLPQSAVSPSVRESTRMASQAMGGQNHIMYRYSDVKSTTADGEPLFKCGVKNGQNKQRPASLHAVSEHELFNGHEAEHTLDIHAALQNPLEHQRRLLQLKRWANCFPDPNIRRTLRLGIAVDKTFYNFYDGDTSAIQAKIGSLVAQTNAIYRAQMNVVFVVASTYIKSTWGGEAWNPTSFAACGTIDAKLENFAEWQSRPVVTGLWHLLTVCYEEGTVGLAYLGTIGLKYLNTGVTSYYAKFVVTFAHEIGHNFGAEHTFEMSPPIESGGGIMSYETWSKLGPNDSENPNQIAFHSRNKEQMCTNITAALSLKQETWGDQRLQLNQVWATAGSVCGDGIVDEGEDCDTGGVASSCCTTLCKFTPGSECVSGECCENCLLKTSNSPCEDGSGYCMNGMCVESTCYLAGLKYCGALNGCVQKCIYGGSCVALTSITDNSIIAAIKDGALCNRSPYSICRVADQAKERTGVCTATYSWSTGDWGPCDTKCAPGTRTRTVTCTNGAFTLDELYCDANKKPATSESCNSCPTWVFSPWSTCSLKCWSSSSTETGLRLRTRSCVDSNTGALLNDAECDADEVITEPISEECTASHSCSPPAYVCRPTSSSSLEDYTSCDQESTWDPCTVSCGRGVQTRSLACRRDTTLVDLAECTPKTTDAVSIQLPPVQRECVGADGTACTYYEWRANAWPESPCVSTCGAASESTWSRTKSCWRVSIEDGVRTEAITTDGSCVSSPSLELTTKCIAPACYSYTFITGDYGDCDTKCGTGTRYRNVYCIESPTGMVVDYNKCFDAGLTKPIYLESCEGYACPTSESSQLVWSVSNWGGCSAACEGQRERTVECYYTHDPDTKYTYSSSTCQELGTPPISTEACGLASCSGYWYVGEFGDCSQQCISDSSSSQGTMERTVECRHILTDEVLDASSCSTHAKPATSAPCNRFRCPQWVPTPWSRCSQPCGIGHRKRTIQCVDAMGTVVDDSKCASLSKDALPAVEVCKGTDCPFWRGTDPGQCDGECGAGKASRVAECRIKDADGNIWKDTNPFTHNATCTFAMNDTKPALEADCVNENSPCGPYRYITEAWSTCSKSCGGGTQQRPVKCVMTATGTEVAASFCTGTRPVSSRTCNAVACNGEWKNTIPVSQAPCSVECGKGVLETYPICVNANNGTVLPDSSCDVSKKYTYCEHGCGTFGRCIKTASSGAYAGLGLLGGYCSCASGYTGQNCDVKPTLTSARVATDVLPTRGVAQLHWTYQGMHNATLQIYAVPAHSGHSVPTTLGTLLGRTMAANEGFTAILPGNLKAGAYTFRLFFGADLQVDTPTVQIGSPCGSKSCGAHGTCDSETGKCQCLEGWEGETCSISVCDKLDCHSTFGTCDIHSRSCKCSGGYSGKQCRIPPNCNNPITCLNDGAEVSCSTCSCVNNWVTSGTYPNKGCDSCTMNCNGRGEGDWSCSKCKCNDGFYSGCACPYMRARMLLNNVDAASRSDLPAIASTFRGELAPLLSLPVSKLRISASAARNGRVQLVILIGSALCDGSFDDDTSIIATDFNMDSSYQAQGVTTPFTTTSAASLSISEDDRLAMLETANLLTQLFTDPLSDLYRGAASQYIDTSAGLGLVNPNCDTSIPDNCPTSIGGGGVDPSGSSSSSNSVIIAAVVAGVVALLLILVIIFLRRRRSNNQSDSDDGKNDQVALKGTETELQSVRPKPSSPQNQQYPGRHMPQQQIYSPPAANTPPPIPPPPSKPLPPAYSADHRPAVPQRPMGMGTPFAPIYPQPPVQAQFQAQPNAYAYGAAQQGQAPPYYIYQSPPPMYPPQQPLPPQSQPPKQ